MAYLPAGFGAETAKAEATIARDPIKDGDYVLMHRTLFLKNTQKGEAIIIEHTIMEAKALVPGITPSPVGTKWGYFLPRYGDAAVMCKGNLKTYVLAMFGPEAKQWSEQEIAARVDAMGDERQYARGMLIRGVTFHTTTKKSGEDFTGVNFYPIPGENVYDAPSVAQRRSQVNIEEGVATANSAAVASLPPPPVTAPVMGSDPLAGWTPYPGKPGFFYKGQEIKSEADLKAAVALPPPPPLPAAAVPPPPPADPFAGWTAYPGRDGWFYKGQEVKSADQLRAGK